MGGNDHRGGRGRPTGIYEEAYEYRPDIIAHLLSYNIHNPLVMCNQGCDPGTSTAWQNKWLSPEHPFLKL